MDGKIVHLVCCDGKVTFESYDLAVGVHKKRSRSIHSLKRSVYKCPVCFKWHIGRRLGKGKAENSPKKRIRIEEGL